MIPVATGFPTGQVPLKTRLEEIRSAVADGASEIDIVINRYYALTGKWKGEGGGRLVSEGVHLLSGYFTCRVI